ncbi:hypothetical protein, partial [Escherichia coli]|uniref:hypothetical protein n=1 Tax=Escherichia coli TaxID=562 RepID=UPI003D088589
DRVPLILDDGVCAAGLESTIVMGQRILRPGPISGEDLGLPLAYAGGKVIAPGQMATHYAPAKPLRLNATLAEAGEWLIGFGEVAGDDTLSASGDPVEAA